MSNFRLRLREATKTLATGQGDVKNRLILAITQQLLMANFPDAPSIPRYFRNEQSRIVADLSARTWTPSVDGDRVRATITRLDFETAASYAERVWKLYTEFEEYMHSNFVPPIE